MFGYKLSWSGLILALTLVLSSSLAFAQERAGILRGRITDQFDAVVVGASVRLSGEGGFEKSAQTNGDGVYTFNNLAPGRYTLTAIATGFALLEKKEIVIGPGRSETLDLKLEVTIEKQEVTVDEDSRTGTAPENNGGALVLRGEALNALPSNPDDLAAYLQALAGPSAGPSGPEFFIDGFSGGRIPSKESIKEIRINQNPFSAEFDRIGFGRIMILTKPGTDRLRGEAGFDFNDESLNSRNPFAPRRAPFQERALSFNIGGPLAKKASFFLDLQKRDTFDNAVINATILDPFLNITGFGQSVIAPQKSFALGSRLDYQLHPNHTLVGRFSFYRSQVDNAGVGGFALASRAYSISNSDQLLQASLTSVLGPSTANEVRFQFSRQRIEQRGDNSTPAIEVLDAFSGGGSPISLTSTKVSRLEIHDAFTWVKDLHTVRAGVRLRNVRLSDVSPQNFNGTFTFEGGLAPLLDAHNDPVLDANGQPVLTPITSLERYRRFQFFRQERQLTGAQIRALGGGPTQFTIAGGNPDASVGQWDLGAFVQDDWQLRQNFTLSLGLRYEKQTNISSKWNFAPRIGFGWALGARDGHQPQLIIRGGFGIFYERFSENLTLQARRFNGLSQQQFIVTDPSVLDLYPAAPTLETLSGFALPQTVRNVASDLQAPHIMQSAISIERQLPLKTNLTVTFINTRVTHMLRSRNINAPLAGTFIPGVAGSGTRPLGNIGNIFEFESSGRYNQSQLVVNLRGNLGRRVNFFGSYGLNKASSDTDGPLTFPTYSYALDNEYGPASTDVRHYLFLGSFLEGPWGLRIGPGIVARSGVPFNITTGQDTNGDALFTDRPAFATDPNKPGVIQTRYGALDPNPAAGATLVPRNYGRGPAFFLTSLHVEKSFSFGGGGSAGPPPGPPPPGPPPPGPPPGGEQRFHLSLSLEVFNILNHANLGTPVGNLSSPLFDQSNTTAGGFGFGGGRVGFGGNPQTSNRRIIFGLRFRF
jgi:hypothetical protein